MWDDRREVGVLNGFGFARLGDEEETGGMNSRGARPFVALELSRPKGKHEKTPRLYRHDAESFAWSLFYLCGGRQGEDGQIYPTVRKDPLDVHWRDGLYPEHYGAVYHHTPWLAHLLQKHRWPDRKTDGESEELADERVFTYLVETYEEALDSEVLGVAKKALAGMRLKYLQIVS